MIYELINPSDPVTIEAQDERVAIVATLLIGGGAYGLRRVDEDGSTQVDVPLLMFYPEQERDQAITAFAERVLGMSVPAFLDQHLSAVALCMESAVVGNASARAGVIAVADEVAADDPTARQRALDRWNDRQRGSLNDICGRAAGYAKRFRLSLKAREEAGSR